MTRACASTVTGTPAEQGWRHLRDFGNIARHWETGQVFRKPLLALSDVEHYVYEACFEGLKALIARSQDPPHPAREKARGQGAAA